MSSGWVAGRTVKPTHFPDGFFGARVFEVDPGVSVLKMH
jgi:hypothetical protein